MRTHIFGALLAVAACVSSAQAGSGCDGTVVATKLHPLPTAHPVALDIANDSPENRDLGERFLAGLREAGVPVATPQNTLATAPLRLSLRTSVLSRGRVGGGSGNFGAPADRDWDDFGWGRNDPAGYRMSSRPQRGRNQIAVRAELTQSGSAQTLWVASIQCQQTSEDLRDVAFGLGQAIGQVFGQQVTEPRRF